MPRLAIIAGALVGLVGCAAPPAKEITIAEVLAKMEQLRGGMTESQVAGAFFNLKMNDAIHFCGNNWQARIVSDQRTHTVTAVTLLRTGDRSGGEPCAASIRAELHRRYGKPVNGGSDRHLTALYFGPDDRAILFADGLAGVNSGGPMISRSL